MHTSDAGQNADALCGWGGMAERGAPQSFLLGLLCNTVGWSFEENADFKPMLVALCSSIVFAHKHCHDSFAEQPCVSKSSRTEASSLPIKLSSYPQMVLSFHSLRA